MNQDQQLAKGVVTDDHICAMAESAGFAYVSIDETDLLNAMQEDASVKLSVIAFARALLALPR